MGLLDALRGKTKQVAPNLDAVFALPGAAITIETQLDMVPSGHAGLCFKAGSGDSEVQSETEIRELLEVDGEPSLDLTEDDLGFKWLLVNSPDLSEQVTRIHSANSTLVEHGLGPRLLCAVFGFVPKAPSSGNNLKIVYLMKQGTFYPFVPLDGEHRDNELELRVKSFVSTDLPIEPDLSRWMALWGVPVS